MTDASLTICSVSYESGRLVALNVALARELNPGAAISWRIAENSPEGSDLRVDGSLDVDLRPGVPVPTVAYQPASYHHGAALNTLLVDVETRHVVVSDPDFFVILPEWIEVCRRHVIEHDLAFFGAPWHPKWFTKPRGFPSPHFLWIDGGRVDVGSLDFSPDSEEPPWQALYRASRLRRGTDRVVGGVVPQWMQRRTVGRSRDTGRLVHDRFATTAGSECLTPFYDSDRHRPGGRANVAGRLADRLLPSHLRMVPDREAITPRGFSSHGLPDLDARGWEEFLWRGQPFGFHVRGYPARAHDDPVPDPADDVAHALEQIRASGRGVS